MLSGGDWCLRVLWAAGLLGVGMWIGAMVQEAVSRERVDTQKPELTPMYPWEVPFPAITICTQIKYKGKKDGVDRDMAQMPDEILVDEVEESKNMVCNTHVIIKGNVTSSAKQTFLIRQLAPKLDEILLACAWENGITDCENLFQETFTSEGLCFNFNMLKPEDMFNRTLAAKNATYWTAEGGYGVGLEYPRRWEMGGIRHGLRVVLYHKEDNHDALCKGPLKGFSVHIHSPSDVPMMDLGFIRVPPNQEVLIAMEPEIRVEKAKCVERGTRKLEGFREYTKTNCKMNCLKKYMKKDCKCLPFWLAEDGYPLCGPASKKCIVQAADVMGRKEKPGAGLGCDCLPQCRSISYRAAEISQNPFYWNDSVKAFQKSTEMKDYTISRLTIYSREISYVYPTSYNPVIINKYGNPWIILVLTGLCLLIYLGLLYRVSHGTFSLRGRSQDEGEASITENMHTNQWSLLTST